MIPLPPPRLGTMKKSSLAGGQNGESNLASPKCAFHVLTTLPQCLHNLQPRPQGFSLKKWVGREKALASAGHVSPRTP